MAKDTKPLDPQLENTPVVKLIGLGGVGGIVARYLLLFLAAAGTAVRVVLIDGDHFEPRNGARMAFSRAGNKARVVCDDLAELVDDSGVTLSAVEEYVTPENLERLLQDGDLVLLAVDNHATRNLVGEHCRLQLADVCLISGGNDGIGEDGSGRMLRGTYGNVQVHRRRRGVDETPPLSALHPEISDPKDRLPSDPSCGEAFGSVPQILFANLATASAMLNAFLLEVSGELGYGELCFDIAEGLMRPVWVPESPSERRPG